jgi:hypothetical protein
MYRRVVALILLPGLLLAQPAVLGHAHGHDQPVGHDLRPHFHANLAPADHGHHHHGPDGHRHHHHDEHDDGPAGPAAQSGPVPDHDADAVFVTDVTAVPVERNPVADGSVLLTWLLPSFEACWTRGTDLALVSPHPPPIPSTSCPLYVRQLTLLI